MRKSVAEISFTFYPGFQRKKQFGGNYRSSFVTETKGTRSYDEEKLINKTAHNLLMGLFHSLNSNYVIRSTSK